MVRPVVAELRRRFEVAVAEAGHLDLHRRALLGVSCVAADAGHVTRCWTGASGCVAARPGAGAALGPAAHAGPED